MPLDGHDYLVSQGWTGKGTALREGAITRPITISQKKSLAGVGKDRDEAFPFWDHVFNAAASTIRIQCGSSDEEDDKQPAAAQKLKRTSTGILSNKRPSQSTPTDSSVNNLGLLTNAKRAAAKQSLYSRFHRGPVIHNSEHPPAPPTKEKKRKRHADKDLLNALMSSSTSLSKKKKSKR